MAFRNADNKDKRQVKRACSAWPDLQAHFEEDFTCIDEELLHEEVHKVIIEKANNQLHHRLRKMREKVRSGGRRD